MRAVEIPTARVFIHDTHFATITGDKTAHCTCSDLAATFGCDHITAARDRIAEQQAEDAHRHQAQMVEYAIRVLPDVRRAA